MSEKTQEGQKEQKSFAEKFFASIRRHATRGEDLTGVDPKLVDQAVAAGVAESIAKARAFANRMRPEQRAEVEGAIEAEATVVEDGWTPRALPSGERNKRAKRSSRSSRGNKAAAKTGEKKVSDKKRTSRKDLARDEKRGGRK